MSKAATESLFPKLFANEGEMSLLIRDYNWSATSIGPIEQWSAELRTTVSILLHSSFPMFLYWGEEQICFYNDAFRPSLGEQGKHPQILGMKGKDAWSEIWNEIEPLLRQVTNETRLRLFEDRLLPIFRNGRIEDVYWTFGYTPVYENSTVKGVLVICTETTQKVNKFHQVVEQTRSPILLVKGEQLLIEELNQATLELWKKNRSIVGKPLTEVVPELEPQGYPAILLTVLRTGITHHGWEEPAFFEREHGNRELFYFNFEMSPYREANGDISGVMVLSTDVTEQVKMRNKLNAAEIELGMAMDAAELGSWLYNPSTNSFKSNARTRELLGWPPEAEIKLEEAILSVHPDDREVVLEEYYRALNNQNGGKLQLEFRALNPRSGTQSYIRVVGRAYFGLDDKPYYFSGTLQDITEARLADEALAYRNALLEAQNNAIPDGMLIVDTKGKILSFNKRFSDIWNMPKHILDAKDDDAALDHAMNQMIDPESFIRRVKFLYEKGLETNRDEIFLKDGRILERFGNSVIDNAGKRYGWAWYFRDVTKEKRAEEELFIRKERYRLTFENAAVGIAHVALDGRWLNVNDRLCAIFGYSRQEMLDLTFQKLTHPEDLAEDYAMISRLMEGELSSFSMEKRFMHKKGSVVWVDISVSLIRNLPGNEAYFITVIADITQRILAEDDLNKIKVQQEETLALLESLLQNAPIGFAFFDKEYRFIMINETLASIRKLSVSEHIGKHIMDISPVNGKLVLPIIDKVIKTRQPVLNLELKGESYDENFNSKYWLMGFYPVINERTAEVDRVGAILLDITDRKRAEAAIFQSEERLRILANSIQNLAWMADASGYINWYNQRWYEYTGLGFNELRGEGWMNLLHAEHVDTVADFIKEAWKKNEPWELTFPLRRHDGEYRWFLTRAYPVKDSEGFTNRWIGTNTDIDDQKTITEKLETLVTERTMELQMANRELQRSNADLQQFAHVASHDLKEPVRKIKTFTGRLKSELEGQLKGKPAVFLDKIESAVDRMYAMIDGVLMYSSMQALNQSMEEINLRKMVEEVISDLELIIQQKKARIVYDNLPVVKGSSLLLHQLFYNLIGNSLKFTRAGVDPLIVLSFDRVKEKDQEYFRITITDNGIGFHQEDAEKIFHTFSRLNSKDKFEGTGLGLALCKNIVERHGGKIWAEGKPDEGATVTILLP